MATAEHHEAPLVVLGQGDYRQAYPAPKAADGRHAVLHRNIATLQARAGAVCGRAGWIGHAHQHYGPATAARELLVLGRLVDDLAAVMRTVAEQLDEEVDR